MKTRCYNSSAPFYNHYGGRGIVVCDEWKTDFMSFYNWANQSNHIGLTLDRINNDGNYEPDNCKWSTSKEQAINRRPKGSKSGYRYIQWDKAVSKWRVQIGKQYLGRFDTIEQAFKIREEQLNSGE